MKSVKIIGTGSYAPERILTNREIEERGLSNDAWIVKNVGIRERHIAAKDQATSDLAVAAGIRAIKDAGLSNKDIDLIIVATGTLIGLAYSLHCAKKLGLFKRRLLIFRRLCRIHLWIFQAASPLSPVIMKILVIGADTFSRITD